MAPTKKLAESLCSCIKKVRKTVKVRKGVQAKTSAAAKESAAIGICVRSVLHSRGKTIKRFRCGGKKPSLTTQPVKAAAKNAV